MAPGGIETPVFRNKMFLESVDADFLFGVRYALSKPLRGRMKLEVMDGFMKIVG